MTNWRCVAHQPIMIKIRKLDFRLGMQQHISRRSKQREKNFNYHQPTHQSHFLSTSSNDSDDNDRFSTVEFNLHDYHSLRTMYTTGGHHTTRMAAEPNISQASSLTLRCIVSKNISTIIVCEMAINISTHFSFVGFTFLSHTSHLVIMSNLRTRSTCHFTWKPSE